VKDKVVIGWIDGGTVHTGFAAHLAQILLHRGDRIDSVVASSSPYLSHNRNMMVQNFLATSAEWLLSLDSDICVDLDSFDALLELADKKTHPIVGGKYFLPLNNGQNVVVSATTWDRANPGKYIFIPTYEAPTPVENLHAIGLGYGLIHRSIFESVAKRYPDNPWPWFQDEYRADLDNWVSDDMHFFDKVHKLGDINVTLCTAANSIHLKTAQVTESAFLRVTTPHSHHGDFGAPKKISWWAKGKGHK